MRAALRFAVILGLFAVATPALAQFEATKFPVDGVIFDPAQGQYVADPGSTIRWRVVLNSLLPLPIGQDANVDFVDVVGGDSCSGIGGPPVPCGSEMMLDLLCPADPMDPDAPDGAGFTVNCDDAGNTISIDRIFVPAGGQVCIEFSTVLDPMAAGFVGNAGCVNVIELGQIAPTSPADVTAGTWPWDCMNLPTAAAMPGCTLLFAVQLPDFDFEVIKTAAHDDADGNGLVDVGEEITWTVTMTDTSTDMMDVTAYIFDTIEADQDFVRIDTDVPGGNCAYDMGRGEVICDPIVFADGDSHVLEFTTVVNCNAITTADDNQICNQARICGDETGASCAPSDDDGVINGLPDATCLPFNQVEFTSAEKTWSWTDNDGDGALTDGDTVDYSITVTNTGSRDATNVVIDDDVSANIDPATGCYDEMSIVVNDGGSYDAILGVITWTIPALAVDETVTVTFSVNVTENPPCCNVAVINSDERTAACPASPGIPSDDPSQMGDSDPTCLIFGPQPLLVVEKDFTESVPDGQVMVGEDITFSVLIRNDGAGAATSVVMNDLVFGCFSNCSLPPTIIGEGVDNSTGPGMGTACTINVSDIGGADGLLQGEEVVIEWTVTVDSLACCNQASVRYAESVTAVTSVDPTNGEGNTCVARAETDCTNMIDDDGDGFTDCDDADCAMDPACVGTENCSNGTDDDGDGNVDCETGNEDADCPCGPETDADMNCDDGVDNDGDGLTDLDDPDCFPPEDCTNGVDDDGDGNVDCELGNEDADCPCGPESTGDMNCDDGVDNDGDGLTDLDDPDCMLVEDCSNGTDDDGDGNVDCELGNEDADCPCGPESIADMNCGDGVDNDGDGLTDDLDPDCIVTEDCTNGIDDNGDGLVDCDPAGPDPTCPCGPESDADMNCGDGVDNDGDGLTDAADPDCAGAMEDCTNGVDDDADGDIDCADEDCVADPACASDDFDGDGVPNDLDCAPTDPEVWAPPEAITGQDISTDPATGDTLITWDCLAVQAGPGTVYDVVRGTLAQLIADRGTDGAECVENDHVDASPDCRPSFQDSGPFAPGESYYYMVRGQNSCGTGSYGSDSSGMERTVGVSDCP